MTPAATAAAATRAAAPSAATDRDPRVPFRVRDTDMAHSSAVAAWSSHRTGRLRGGPTDQRRTVAADGRALSSVPGGRGGAVVRALDRLHELGLVHPRAALHAQALGDVVEVRLRGVRVDAASRVTVVEVGPRLGAAAGGLRVARALLGLLLPVVADLLERRPCGGRAPPRSTAPRRRRASPATCPAPSSRTARGSRAGRCPCCWLASWRACRSSWCHRRGPCAVARQSRTREGGRGGIRDGRIPTGALLATRQGVRISTARTWRRTAPPDGWSDRSKEM